MKITNLGTNSFGCITHLLHGPRPRKVTVHVCLGKCPQAKRP